MSGEMSAEIEALNQYLGENRELVDSGRTVHFALGNEASDLDSMASSVMYALYAARLAGDQQGDLFLPLINIPRADFRLRTEAVYLFDAVGLRLENLLFVDEVDLGRLHEKGLLRLTLVDHNKLASSQSAYEDSVEAIVDHHRDEGFYREAAPRLIEPVGSAATLVAQRIIVGAPGLIDRGTGTLLLGTILLDTVNLDPEAKRVTPGDEEAARALLERTGADQKALFEKLQSEKFNVSSLGTRDLLRKDYKEWELGRLKCGIASVLMPLKQWIEKDPDIAAGFRSYAGERGLDLLVAMNAYTDPEFHRDLAVYSPDGNLRRKTIDWLQDHGLKLAPLDAPAAEESGTISFFTQGDLSISRKKLQPLLSELFSA